MQSNVEKERERKKLIEDAKFAMYTSKKKIIQEVKQNLQKDFQRKEHDLQEELMAKVLQRETIKQLAIRSKNSVENIKLSKIEMTKAEFKRWLQVAKFKSTI